MHQFQCIHAGAGFLSIRQRIYETKNRDGIVKRPNWASYASVVQADLANAHRDSAVINGTRVYYNGIETMQQKATCAAEHAGVNLAEGKNVAAFGSEGAAFAGARAVYGH